MMDRTQKNAAERAFFLMTVADEQAYALAAGRGQMQPPEAVLIELARGWAEVAAQFVYEPPPEPLRVLQLTATLGEDGNCVHCGVPVYRTEAAGGLTAVHVGGYFPCRLRGGGEGS